MDGPTADARHRASILLLSWRDAAFIEEAVRGALAQTVACEIVVSNDASGDATHERASALLAGYEGPHSVKVRCNERNLGVAAHVSATVPLTRGEIIVMMAGDDVSVPHRVERVLQAFDANPGVMALASQFDAIDAEGRPVELHLPFRRERFGLDYFVSSGRLMGLLGATLAFRREVFDRFGPIRGPIEDNALSLRAALLGDCLKLREPLVRYRQHSGSVSADVFAKSGSKDDAKRRRYQRTIDFYRGTADDLEHCLAQLPDLPETRRRLARDILAMYRIEADARAAMLDAPRMAWIGPILRGLGQRGLRRKSAERALKLLLPRRFVGV
ncbi:glycosyltransferase [Lysobacter korlensis]|uniref:Glycosyltransferase n=1 Tax=Lysobacter korlensis TaxID=553636 RepID=A0ABV6RSG5_9GAMM